MQALVGFHHQVQRRGDEAQQHGNPAQRRGDQRRRTAQAARLHRAHALGVGIALALASMPFQQDQADDDGQHGQRDLGRAGQSERVTQVV